MHSVHVSVKILRFGELNTGWSTPIILPQGKHPPRIAHWKGINIEKGGTEDTGFFWDSWGSEAPKLTLTLHLPNELNPLLNSLTPLITCPKVGTFGMRPMDE